MDRSCMSCARRSAVTDTATGRTSCRCAMDEEMKVNRRMHCAAWIPWTPFAAGLADISTIKRK